MKGKLVKIALPGLVLALVLSPMSAMLLTAKPVEAGIGESINISVLLTNTGEEEGSHPVTLEIEGVLEETKEITLAGGDSTTVTFTMTKDKAGTYSVDANGLPGSFTVPARINWATLGPIILVTVSLAIILPIRLWRRRRFARIRST